MSGNRQRPVTGAVKPPSRDPVPPGAVARLRLLATTDLHMQLTAFDHANGRAGAGPGLARVATLIDRARAEAERDGALCLLFDNGDALQGGALGELAAIRPKAPHPMMRAFGQLGYDALGLGNHDFDVGTEWLADVLAQAPCPVVCTNLNGAKGFAPCAVLERSVRVGGCMVPLRVGVLSVLPPQTVMWNAHRLSQRVRTEDIVDAARAVLPALADCDVVVALAHSGPGGASHVPGAENAARALARLDGIDAVIAGHTHETLSRRGGPAMGAPLVMAGANGSHLGVIDLVLRGDDGGRWRRARARVSVHPAGPDVPEDQGLVALTERDNAAAQALMARPVGRIATPLHSYFTFFAPDRALAIIAAAQAAALRPLLAGREEAALPLLSAVAPGRFGARAGPASYTDIPAGPVTLRHLIDLQVFANDLNAVVITGAQLADWIEHSAGVFNRILPGARDAALLDPALPGHDFDVLHGVTCEIDLSRPSRFRPDGRLRKGGGRRVACLRYAGRAVAPDQRFVVALNSFRSAGGGNVAALRNAPRVALPPIPLREALRDYLAGRLGRDPLGDAPPPWRFAPMPGTRVCVPTGPAARAHLGELAGRGVEVGELDEDGFLRLFVPL